MNEGDDECNTVIVWTIFPSLPSATQSRIPLFALYFFYVHFLFQSEPLSVFKVNHHSLCVFIGVWPLHFYLLIVNELIQCGKKWK